MHDGNIHDGSVIPGRPVIVPPRIDTGGGRTREGREGKSRHLSARVVPDPSAALLPSGQTIPAVGVEEMDVLRHHGHVKRLAGRDGPGAGRLRGRIGMAAAGPHGQVVGAPARQTRNGVTAIGEPARSSPVATSATA